MKVRFHRDEEAIREKKARESCFVLMTNVADKERFPDREILRQYKDQQLAEQQFSFIKDPKVVGPVYLKKPERVNALAYVFLLALLVLSPLAGDDTAGRTNSFRTV